MQQVVRHRHWLGHLHQGVLDRRARCGAWKPGWPRSGPSLAEAVKQRKILEKLRERQWRHLQEEERQETRRRADDGSIRVRRGEKPWDVPAEPW